MPHVIDTEKLLGEGILSQDQAVEIARRSREAMTALAVNMILCVGVIAATFGLIFWLADALAVSVAGGIFLLLGLWVLLASSELYRMLGNAAALVGAGMLIGGAGIELVDKFRDIAEPVMLVAGALIAIGAWFVFEKGPPKFGFAAGAILLMGVALHLSGVLVAFEPVTGWPKSVAFAYGAVVIALAGIVTQVRTVTALAILPFAQMLETGTGYYHAAYVFYSPEPTLTILQMAALIGLCVWGARRASAHIGAHLGILAILATVVGNLAFLVATLWGDTLFLSLGDAPTREPGMEWSEFNELYEAYEAQFFHISEHVFTIVWAVLLGIGAFWAAHANKRGLFNAAMTFAGIHAYTQMFESFGDEPLAWAIGGLAAIPLAWGLWRFNQYLTKRQTPTH